MKFDYRRVAHLVPVDCDKTGYLEPLVNVPELEAVRYFQVAAKEGGEPVCVASMGYRDAQDPIGFPVHADFTPVDCSNGTVNRVLSLKK